MTADLEWAKALLPFVVALLAAWLALLANRHLDQGRAQRDFTTKIGEGMRDDIRQAVEAAADYWGPTPTDKSVLEARIKMLEQEIRAASVILDDGSSGAEAVEFRSTLNGFFAVLTGADFDAVAVTPNISQVREITGRGVALRKAIAQFRKSQLKH